MHRDPEGIHAIRVFNAAFKAGYTRASKYLFQSAGDGTRLTGLSSIPNFSFPKVLNEVLYADRSLDFIANTAQGCPETSPKKQGRECPRCGLAWKEEWKECPTCGYSFAEKFYKEDLSRMSGGKLPPLPPRDPRAARLAAEEARFKAHNEFLVAKRNINLVACGGVVLDLLVFFPLLINVPSLGVLWALCLVGVPFGLIYGLLHYYQNKGVPIRLR